MNDEFTRQAVAASLRKMFEGTHLNICAIDDALKALGIKPIAAQYDSLRVLHCVDWARMEPAFREQVYRRVLALFESATAFDLSAIDLALASPALPFSPEKRKVLGLLPFHRRS